MKLDLEETKKLIIWHLFRSLERESEREECGINEQVGPVPLETLKWDMESSVGCSGWRQDERLDVARQLVQTRIDRKMDELVRWNFYN